MGRQDLGIWLICGVAVVAYVTSSVTSVMTTLSLTSQINGGADLPGRPVGVFTGSVAAEYARRNGLDARPYAHIEDAVKALQDRDILAIIGDAPGLEYHAHTNPSDSVKVIGAIFEPDKYGWGLAPNSRLTRRLNVELIGAHEDGLIGAIREKYFGDDGP